MRNYVLSLHWVNFDYLLFLELTSCLRTRHIKKELYKLCLVLFQNDVLIEELQGVCETIVIKLASILS